LENNHWHLLVVYDMIPLLCAVMGFFLLLMLIFIGQDRKVCFMKIKSQPDFWLTFNPI